MIKMQLKNADGTTTQLQPSDERYAVLRANAKTALRSLATLMALKVLVVAVLGSLLATFIFHGLVLLVLTDALALATIVVSRFHVHYKRQVRQNAQTWRERFGDKA